MTFYSALNFETSVRNFINATKALVGVKCLLSAETLAKVRWACKKKHFVLLARLQGAVAQRPISA